ncbi:DUF1579 family protein [Hymenobacter sp. YC55]|uniref:DUF1579 family protein n=1 Tax=Hymenobacter sp. YC55 TaxID=3034019 RepID=UPI0023F81885|nr:DUF1579 family protein [Hymenobacter sp. YC55]MDF7810807.1 DUF1579 family protein [Hymenobacter sp. YC55]
MKTTTLSILISLFVAHAALSQQALVSTKGKATSPVSAASALKAPASTDFHKMLARSNGAWTGEATMTFAPDTPPITSTSTLTNTMVMGGLYQVSEVKWNIRGKLLTGVRTTGYDATKKVFTRAMIQDGGNGVAMEGPWDEASKSFSMRYKQNNSAGIEEDMKEVYTIVNEDTEILEIYRLDPTTKKESRILRVKWTRDK